MHFRNRSSITARHYYMLIVFTCLIPASYSNLYAQACAAAPSGITNWWPFDGPGQRRRKRRILPERKRQCRIPLVVPFFRLVSSANLPVEAGLPRHGRFAVQLC